MDIKPEESSFDDAMVHAQQLLVAASCVQALDRRPGAQTAGMTAKLDAATFYRAVSVLAGARTVAIVLSKSETEAETAMQAAAETVLENFLAGYQALLSMLTGISRHVDAEQMAHLAAFASTATNALTQQAFALADDLANAPTPTEADNARSVH